MADAVREWFALQERKPGCEWEDVISLGCWDDPDIRREALAAFRTDGEQQPGTEYRMVQHVVNVLDE